MTQVIFEDQYVRIAWDDRGSEDQILVCFTDAGLEMGHVGQVMTRVNTHPEQFINTARHLNSSAIYVTDKTVSWGNRVSFDDVARRIRYLIDGKRVTLLGVSMGGFNAIVASQYIKAHLCLAFCPQYSIDPRIVPYERRYETFAAAIDDFRIPSLHGYFNGDCVYYTFNGSQGEDRYHWERFPVLPNARHYLFPDIDHRVARELRNRDVLVALIGACMNGDEPGNILSGNVSYFIHEIDAETDVEETGT